MKVYAVKEHERRIVVIFNLAEILDYQILQGMRIDHPHLLALHASCGFRIETEVFEDAHAIWRDGDGCTDFVLKLGSLKDLILLALTSDVDSRRYLNLSSCTTEGDGGAEATDASANDSDFQRHDEKHAIE
ncbi:hypothetical protein HG530_008584 [Fusarium avenaceum]|nr:hypothetical protein HG530_008584 [Fusarium avenaceum]